MLIKEKEKQMLYVCVFVYLLVCRIIGNTSSLASSWESSQGCRHQHRHCHHHHHHRHRHCHQLGGQTL